MLTAEQEANWQKGLAFLRKLLKKRQGKGCYVKAGPNGDCYCAWGAIMTGAGWDGESSASAFLSDSLGDLSPRPILIGDEETDIFTHVVYWNDRDRLPPKTIADRIEQYILPALRAAKEDNG